MRTRLLTLCVVVSSSAFGQSASAVARAEGNRAYDTKDYARCSQHFLTAAAAASAVPARQSELFYSAACCQALEGKPGLAFATLDRAYDAGLKDALQIKNDADFASISKTERFKAFVDKVMSRDASFEKAAQPKLRDEINQMVKVDQAAREELIKHPKADPELGKRLEEVDKRNTKRMKEIIAKYGWPGQTLVGRKAAQGAWLLVQHADLDSAFQKQALVLIEAAAKKNEVTPANVAYLVDRVATAEKRKQLYGTQFGPDLKPLPIEDEAHVDARRAAIGLEPMADYAEQMKSTYAAQQPAPSTDAGH